LVTRGATAEHGGKTNRDAAVSALFQELYGPLRRLAYYMTGDAGVAEDVAMDVFAKALAGWRLFRRVEGPPAYMRRMVINACRSRYRRRSLEDRTKHLFRRDEVDPSGVELRGEALDVWSAVAKLPYSQRACVVLRYVEDLTEAEIARLLDCSLGTVKSHLSRARSRLSLVLGPSFFGGET
jgi:RNA polymerase sigma-70 factor (sigma-E family)